MDSIKQGLVQAGTTKGKAWWLDNLSRTLMNVNQAEAEKYGQQLIAPAALLEQLPHWMEHKLKHYLTSHNRLTAAGHHIKNKIFRRNGRTDL